VYLIGVFCPNTEPSVLINIGLITEIEKSNTATDDGFKDLVIPEGHRDLLIALVQNHATQSGHSPDRRDKKVDRTAVSAQIDIVRGRGRGLIILLHGPLGSGKTITAETIAAYTHPSTLYSLTCRDLGSWLERVDRP
jgi:hypothetical protein